MTHAENDPHAVRRIARVLQDWGAELKATRQAQGRSAEHVAAAAGITRKTLQRVERGDPAAAPLLLVQGPG
jgi:DNA-binding XRE family transcriptional regulator